jgi:ABC-type nickel/cobalt efflux system permease component RcnA
MIGLDDWLAGYSDGVTLWLVIVVAILLGLRHATDPDHVVAVTTLVAGGGERAARSAARLGLAWGLGHALTLFLFGLPVLLFASALPAPVERSAETAVAALIVYLALRLLIRWRRGDFRFHDHPHAHAHSRTPLAAFGIGLVHGLGGSAGVGVLLVATIDSSLVAVLALAIFAFFTAVSMTSLTTGFGLTLASGPARRGFERLAPALGIGSLAFGLWYASAAWALTSYPF